MSNVKSINVETAPIREELQGLPKELLNQLSKAYREGELSADEQLEWALEHYGDKSFKQDEFIVEWYLSTKQIIKKGTASNRLSTWVKEGHLEKVSKMEYRRPQKD